MGIALDIFHSNTHNEYTSIDGGTIIMKRNLLILFSFISLFFFWKDTISAKAETNTYDITEFGANGTDTDDDYSAFVKAFNMAKGSDSTITITIPAGTYYISNYINVYSNTTVIADKNAIIKATYPDGAMLVGRHTYEDGTACSGSSCTHGGHTQTQNVTINGGVWDRNDLKGEGNSSVLSFRHGENINFKNLTVKNGTSHLINLSGTCHANVSNVTFENSIKYTGTSTLYWGTYTPGDDTRYNSIEVLHIDFMTSNGEPMTYPSDGTPAENIYVTNCTFKNVFSGIGTHHLDSGNQGNNIVIKNNTFTNLKGVCVNLYDFNNISVTGNTANTGLMFAYSARCQGNISNNTIKNMSGCSIYLVNQASGYVNSNKISRSTGAAIRINDNCRVTVSGNTISNSSDAGISATLSSTTRITGNTITSSTSNAIRVDSGSTVISENIIKTGQGNGIYLLNLTGGSATSNQISGTRHGISLTNCKKTAISSNIIKNITATSIFVENGSNCSINKNTISTANLGIYTLGISGCQITDNSISGCTSHALFIKGTSTKPCTATATGNTLISTSSSVKSVRLTGYCKNCIISNNTIGSGGFAADSTCSYTAKGNLLKGLSQPAFTLANSASGVTISWNKISGASGYLIFRKVSGGKWTCVGKTTSSVLQYTDKTAASGKAYAYTVRAYKSQNNILLFSTYNATGRGILTIKQPVLNVDSEAASGVKLSWQKSTGAKGYYIYRKAYGGSWTKLKTITGTNTLSYTDTTTKKGTTYYYIIRAYNGSYLSAWSNTLTVTLK
jgi:parallel beta-helix repeat protein